MTDTANIKPSNTGRKIFSFLFILIVLSIGISYFIFTFTYSEGNRAGVVMKFSKKGYVFKTYEGELNMGGMNTIVNTAQANHLWQFTVANQKVADTMMKLEGRRVSLHYEEKIKALPWIGETVYLVDGVQVIP